MRLELIYFKDCGLNYTLTFISHKIGIYFPKWKNPFAVIYYFSGSDDGQKSLSTILNDCSR